VTTPLVVLNEQPVSPVVPLTDPPTLSVVGSPWLTIQGEGPLAGTRAVFVRLAGCTLRCLTCFHANTVIRMADMTTKLIAEVCIGDYVLSYSVKRQKFVKRKVTAVMSSQTTAVYRVTTPGPKKTYVTGDHPFLVRGRGWVAAKDLDEGDHVIHLSTSEQMRIRNPMKVPEVVARVVATSRKRGNYDQSPWDRLTEEKKVAYSLASSERMSGDGNPMKDPAVAIKGFLARKDRGTMTTAERFLAKVAKSCGVTFVGGGDLVVSHKVPDFVIDGNKKVIEVWDEGQTDFLGRDHDWMERRRAAFAAEGYEVLFLPLTPYPLNSRVGTRKPERAESRRREIVRVRKLVSEFARNGHIIQSVTRVSRKHDRKAWARLAGDTKSKLTVYNLEVEGTHTYVADGMVVHNCDTDYTTDARDVAVESLAATVNLLMIGADRWGDVAGGDRWKILANRSVVVITGGEPMRQEALVPFVRHLTLDYGLAVQIETNGTLGLEDLPWLSDKLSVVVSPKASYIHPLIREYATAYKFVVTADKIDTARGLPTVVLGRPVKFTFDMLGDTSRRQIYVQPEDAQDDEQNAKNLKAALWVVETFGHRLSVQTHKMIGVP